MGLFRAPRLPQAEHICVSANPSAPLWVYSASLEVSFFAPTAVTFSVAEPVSSSGILYDYRLKTGVQHIVAVGSAKSVVTAYDSVTPVTSGSFRTVSYGPDDNIPFYSRYRQRPSVESNDDGPLYITPNNFLVPFSSSNGGEFMTSNVPVFNSNCTNNGDGTSYVQCHDGGNNYSTDLVSTGDITVNLWFDLKGYDINVGGNNNWRTLLGCAAGTAGFPITMVLEQSRAVNFTTGHDDGGGVKRYINGQFAPYTATANGWQMLTFTYDSATGIAACYKNKVLVTSGSMSTSSGGANATVAGDRLSYTNYISNGFRFSNTNSSTNPAGNGCIPGELGYLHIWNKALTFAEIEAVYDNTGGGFKDGGGGGPTGGGLTEFSSSAGNVLSGVCSDAINVTYFHNGSGTFPTVGDVVYTDETQIQVLPAFHYKYDTDSVFKIANPDGIVTADLGNICSP